MSDPTATKSEPSPEPASASAPPEAIAPVRYLARSSRHRVLGGVCGGLAERFDVDPVVVRVIVVVLALFWGLGVLIYLAMWVVVPGDGAAPEGPPAEAGHAGWWLRVALPLGALVAVAVVVLALVGHAGARPARALGFFWLFCLVILAVVALRGSSGRFTLRRVVALCFLGLVSVVTLAVTALLVTLAVVGVPIEGGSGFRTDTPISLTAIPPAYHGAYGETRIDLTQVPFGSGTYLVRATQAVGQLVVEVPADVRVVVTSHVGIGGAVGPPDLAGALTPGGRARAGTLILDLSVGVGRIEVERTAPSNG